MLLEINESKINLETDFVEMRVLIWEDTCYLLCTVLALKLSRWGIEEEGTSYFWLSMLVSAMKFRLGHYSYTAMLLR